MCVQVYVPRGPSHHPQPEAPRARHPLEQCGCWSTVITAHLPGRVGGRADGQEPSLGRCPCTSAAASFEACPAGLAHSSLVIPGCKGGGKWCLSTGDWGGGGMEKGSGFWVGTHLLHSPQQKLVQAHPGVPHPLPGAPLHPSCSANPIHQLFPRASALWVSFAHLKLRFLWKGGLLL